MDIKKEDTVVVFNKTGTIEAPVTEVNEDGEFFKVTLQAGGKMAFRFPNPFGNCDGYGHDICAKVKS